MKDAGAYVVDMRIKRVPELAGIKPRLFKTTGVYPGQRNAEAIVREMKLMIKELIRERDAVTLRKIQENRLSLPSAYKKWKSGLIHLAEGFEDRRVVKSWEDYYHKAPLADKTKTNRLAIIASLVAKELLSDRTVVNELPALLPRIRHFYAVQKHPAAFNTIRIEVGAFLTKGLGIESESPFVRAVLRTQPLKLGGRRDHHPFHTPRECAEFCQSMIFRTSPHIKLYIESILFMCMHGLRPEEFAGMRFAIDSETEHLRVSGTKNPNAKRVVPLLWTFPDAHPPRIDTLNRTFERMDSHTRCRDFRRTYAIWCELAGIPNSRIQAYLGHAAQTVTQTYQSTVPTQATLDHDRDQLIKWYQAELAKAPVKRKQGPSATAFGALMHTIGPGLGRGRSSITAQPPRIK